MDVLHHVVLGTDSNPGGVDLDPDPTLEKPRIRVQKLFGNPDSTLFQSRFECDPLRHGDSWIDKEMSTGPMYSVHPYSRPCPRTQLS